MVRTTAEVATQIFEDKYCAPGMSEQVALETVGEKLGDSDYERREFKRILTKKLFLPAGRVLSSFAASRATTPLNCFVSETILDSMEGIMGSLARAAEILRRGGGIGYDFSTIRPRGTPIKSFDTSASGPISFMHVFEAMAKTISSAGERRGAQMAILRCDHPDIEEFITVKCTPNNPFTMFNLSVGITNEFMDCLRTHKPFALKWNGEVVRTIHPSLLWDKIMDCTWDWADPGVVFIDRMNEMNNLYYCETIAATNPCGEQPLPPNGACLLGSVNLTKFVSPSGSRFDWDHYSHVCRMAVRMLDAVIDKGLYPFEDHELEMRRKRRMGIGVMGFANAGEVCAGSYASNDFMDWGQRIFKSLRNSTYGESVSLAKEKAPFPYYNREKYNESKFIKTLPGYIREDIWQHGIRNSHLTSIAPTGTISLVCGNISSGIEPTFSERHKRKILFKGSTKPKTVELTDWAVEHYNIKPRQANSISATEHLSVLTLAAAHVDSAVSKTCNIGDSVTRDEFNQLYLDAWDGGAKGCTTFRAGGKRFGIIEEVKQETSPAPACYIDPSTGQKICGDG